jgi:hypothetical protein
MAIDYETLRRNRMAGQSRDMSDWDKAQAEQVARDREAYAKSREDEMHRRDCQAFGKFCDRMSERERDRGQTDRARDWKQARENISKGLWSVGRTISSEPAVSAYQHLRTRLLYEGKTARLD